MRNKFKIVIAYILGFISSIIISVFAVNLYNANDVLYTRSDGKTESVEEALNNLNSNTCKEFINHIFTFDFTEA